jgi:hypothetical protein
MVCVGQETYDLGAKCPSGDQDIEKYKKMRFFALCDA